MVNEFLDGLAFVTNMALIASAYCRVWWKGKGRWWKLQCEDNHGHWIVRYRNDQPDMCMVRGEKKITKNNFLGGGGTG